MESKRKLEVVRVRAADGRIESGELHYSPNYGPNQERARGVHIELRMPGREPLFGDGPDYFAALVSLSRPLKYLGCSPSDQRF
jgi:hypothetical protein